MEFPLDAGGCALISGVDFTPSVATFTQMLRTNTAVCVPAQGTGEPNDDDAGLTTPAAHGTDQLCFSSNLALIHAVVGRA